MGAWVDGKDGGILLYFLTVSVSVSVLGRQIGFGGRLI
jgi:hypothetical protein